MKREKFEKSSRETKGETSKRKSGSPGEKRKKERREGESSNG